MGLPGFLSFAGKIFPTAQFLHPMLKPSRIVAKQATLVADKRGVRILSPADILGLYRDDGKENGNYSSILGLYLGLYRNSGKEYGNYYSILGLYRNNGKKMETTKAYWGYIGIMEKNMETTIVYWDYIGIMEKKEETTIVYCG